MRLPANRASLLLLSLLVAVAVLAPPRAIRGQPQPGGYVRVATWQETATFIPPALWATPAGIALTPSGGVFTTDSTFRRVEVLDRAGQPLRTFGRGTSPQDLVSPGHVAVDEGRDRVYVVDAGAARIAVYTLAGAAVGLWTTVSSPAGIAVAADGRLVVTNTSGDRVHVLAPDGRELAGWGGSGAGSNQLDYPGGVDVTTDGTVFVADRGNGRVVATTLDGTAVKTYRLNNPQLDGAEPLDVRVDGDDLWVATDVGIARFSRRSGDLRSILANNPATAVDVQTYGLYATVDALEGYPGVWQFRYNQATGEPEAQWGGPALIPGHFDGLETLTIGDDGRGYLLDVPPRLQRLDGAGVVETQIASPDPVEVDADAAGNIYAVAADQIYAYAPDGSLRWQERIHAVALAGRDVDVTGLAWDATAGELVVLDATTDRLYLFDAQGKELGDWAPPSRSPNQVQWTDLAVGADGTRYLLDQGNGQIRGFAAQTNARIVEIDLPETARRLDVLPDHTLVALSPSGWARRFAPDGTVRAVWDTTRLDRGSESRPADVATDAQGRVMVVDGSADVITVFGWDPAGRSQPPKVVEKGCELGADKLAQPAEITLGEEVTVALSVRGACASQQNLADIALIIDQSMERGRFRAAQRALEEFLQLVDPATDHVAVQPNKHANARGAAGGRLSNDVQYHRRVLRRLDPEYCTWDFEEALNEAEAELFGPRGRSEAKKVVIIILGSRGIPTDLERSDCYRKMGAMNAAGGQLKRRGAEVFGIWLHKPVNVSQCDLQLEAVWQQTCRGRLPQIEQAEKLLKDIGSDTSHTYNALSESRMAELYAKIYQRVKPVTLLQELGIADEIPANMAYVEGSSEPPATLDGRTLRWRLTDVPLIGTGVRYRLRPLEEGLWPTNVYASGTYVDASGKAGQLTFPIPQVRVLAPTATPTPTRIPSATPTATATLTPTVEPTPTPEPQALYLPLLLHERCQPELRRTDVVLVLDASTSMLDASRSGRSKIDAARAAASLFLDQLDLARDQAAIISFNSEVTLLQSLTRDRAALDAALANIGLQSQTRIDLGIATAHAELVSARHDPAAFPAMIVLTDGRANPEPVDTAVARAGEAKAVGIAVFTIGLGDDLEVDALRKMASRPEDFYLVPDGDDLAAIYQSIAAVIPCPPSSYWGGR
jgi:DNA-binding beta-propeller fold protein YncE/Mg-chelatase subunit ChlD